MRTQTTRFRLGATVAIGSLLCGPMLAQAQDAPPAADATAPATATADAAATDAAVDPPARVGRLAALLGTVSFHTTDQTEWQPATLNYPVTSGNAFWTEPAANAELEVGATHLALDQQTEFDLDTLDDHTLAATEPQGAIYLHLRDLAPGDSATVVTPRGEVTITQAGRYEIVAGDTDEPTRLTVVEGAADIAVGDASLHVTAHQSAAVTGSDADSFQGSVSAQSSDPFLAAELAKDRPPPPKAVVATQGQAPGAVAIKAYQPPPLVQNMTGADALATTGQWQPSAQYGHLWYPPVERDWVPYRHGHWAFVAPWGWTWVDDAPWGFAPFHYGRWVHDNDRWGWTPLTPGVPVDVAVQRPCYAPALVSFVGFGAAVGAVVGAVVGARLAGGGPGDGSVGWVPLAPSEAYRPAFNASPSYVRNVNVTSVKNVTNITNVTNNTTTINNYANASAATVVPAAAMTNSQPVAAAVQPVTPQQFAAARPVAAAAAPVRPTLATAGVTPTVARQLDLAPVVPKPGTPAPVTRVAAPGPAIAPPRPVAAKATPAVVAPGAPGEAAKPAAIVKPGEPAKPVEATKPPEVAKPGEVAKPVRMAKPGEPAKPAVPAPNAVAAPKIAAPGPKPAVLPAAKPGTPAAAHPMPPLAAAHGTAPPVAAAAPKPKPALPALIKPTTAAASHAAPTKPAAAKPAPEKAAVAKPAVAQPAPAKPKPALTTHQPAPAAHPAPPVHPPAAPAKPCPAGQTTCT